MDMVVCSGGDGTFNETVTGLMKAGLDLPLGYIPAGSTNDFAASLGLSSDCMEAARQIVEGVPCRYDAGKFGDRYFSYVASFGAFTKASYSTPQNIKNALGHTAYILEGIQELSQLKPTHVRIQLENTVIEDDFLFGAISNSTSLGGVLTLDPKQVDMGDGVFELLLIRAPKDIMELHECVWAVQKQQYNCSMITFVSTRELTVFPNPQMDWTLDGERCPGAESVHVENLHRAIRLMRRA
jgi:YegS/Rv2252/BmrU family lipid kinase